LADTTCKLPEDGVRTPKYVGTILILTFNELISAFVGTYTNCRFIHTPGSVGAMTNSWLIGTKL
jgi:hypothetical protein